MKIEIPADSFQKDERIMGAAELATYNPTLIKISAGGISFKVNKDLFFGAVDLLKKATEKG